MSIVQNGLILNLDATQYSGSGTWYDLKNSYDAILEDGTIQKNQDGNCVIPVAHHIEQEP